MLVRILTIGLITSLGAAGTASAHHSQAQFNLGPAAIQTIEGTVTEFDFRSPPSRRIFWDSGSLETDGVVDSIDFLRRQRPGVTAMQISERHGPIAHSN
jgi:hypothetical protein